MNLDKADLLAALVQVIDGLLGGVAAGAHGDDDAVGVRGAHVVKQLVVAAGQFADLVHDFLDDVRGGQVVFVGSLAALEVDVRVLGRAALMRMLGVERALAEGLDLVPRHEFLHLVILDAVDLLDLVGGAEAVEEVQEGTEAFSADTWATSAMSIASCTLLEASMAKPVWRQAMTSEWSPKIDSA